MTRILIVFFSTFIVVKSRLNKQTVPLTIRLLETSGRRAGKKASARALTTAGYLVKAKDGWVVKEDAAGNITRISEIEKVNIPVRFD